MSRSDAAAKRRAMLAIPVVPAADRDPAHEVRVEQLKSQRAAELSAASRRAPRTPYEGERLRDGPSPHWIEAPVLFDGEGDGDFGRQWRWFNVEHVVAHDGWTWDVDGAELTRMHLANGRAVVLDVLYPRFVAAIRWRQSLIGRFWLALRRLAWRSPQRLLPPRS
jgi:hypothetical protein